MTARHEWKPLGPGDCRVCGWPYDTDHECRFPTPNGGMFEPQGPLRAREYTQQ